MFRSVAEASYKSAEAVNHASYQSTSSYIPSQIVSKIPEDAQKLVHATELITLLAHLKVVSPRELLSESFPVTEEWDRIPNEQIRLSFQRELADYELKFTENQALYNHLKRAFNTCCDRVAPVASTDDYVPTNNLHCANTSSLRPSTEGLTGDPKRRAPDLCLTFDKMKEYSPDTFFSRATAAIEFKSSVTADPGFTAIEIATTSSEQKEQKVEAFSTAAGKMLVQAFEYVFAQWSERPYRHVWSITIACNVMRFWRWSTSGVLVTEAIDYIKDATPVFQFAQALGKGPYSRLGLDIGHGMTFGASGSELQQFRGKIHNIIRNYGQVIDKSDFNVRWTKKALESDIWSFKQPSSVPVQYGVLGTQAPQPLELKHEEALGQNDTATGIHTLYVVSHPIWRGKGIYSRGTRCYLAIYKHKLQEDKVHTVEDAHMLKTSWQFTCRTPEYDFFAHVQARHSGPVPHLASMIAGGNIDSTEQCNGRFLEPAATDQEQQSPQSRHLQWILFKQVGERISGFRSVRELLQTIYDAVVAHENLYNSDILHGDISENNVLIALRANDEEGSARRGLLIDLDMARFIDLEKLDLDDTDPEDIIDSGATPNSGIDYIPEETPDSEPSVHSEGEGPNVLPDITGTLLFMSVAMKERPRNQRWHDMESFYWLLLFVTLRHVRGVKVTISGHAYSLDDAEHRELILRRIFRPPPDMDALNDSSTAKDNFLRAYATFSMAENAAFKRVLTNLYDKLALQYDSFSKATQLSEKLRDIETDLYLPKHKLPLSSIYLARGGREFKQQLSELAKVVEHHAGALKNLSRPQELVKDIPPDQKDALSTIQLDATKPMQDPKAKKFNYAALSQSLKDVQRRLGLLRSDEDDIQFLTHNELKAEISAAIAGQEDISAVPSAPFRPKPIENAAKAVQNAVSRLATPESGSSEVTPFLLSRAGGSGEVSSGERAGSKRKRSPTVCEASTHEKRQKKHHGKASSSARTGRE